MVVVRSSKWSRKHNCTPKIRHRNPPTFEVINSLSPAKQNIKHYGMGFVVKKPKGDFFYNCRSLIVISTILRSIHKIQFYFFKTKLRFMNQHLDSVRIILSKSELVDNYRWKWCESFAQYESLPITNGFLPIYSYIKLIKFYHSLVGN